MHGADTDDDETKLGRARDEGGPEAAICFVGRRHHAGVVERQHARRGEDRAWQIAHEDDQWGAFLGWAVRGFAGKMCSKTSEF